MKASIISIRDEAKHVKEFVLSLESPIRFLPGQYLMLSFEDRSRLRRAYSVASYDAMSRSIRLLVKLEGDFTKKMFEMKPGDEIFAYGPFGKFILRNKKGVFIAGGIGVIPLYSMFRQLSIMKSPDNTCSAYMFYSARHAEEMALRDELSPIENVRLYFTQEGDKKRFGINEIIAIPNYKDYSYYVCGPEEMMNSIVKSLKELGIESIYTESYIM